MVADSAFSRCASSSFDASWLIRQRHPGQVIRTTVEPSARDPRKRLSSVVGECR
jgi:hypothetical protein